MISDHGDQMRAEAFWRNATDAETAVGLLLECQGRLRPSHFSDRDDVAESGGNECSDRRSFETFKADNGPGYFLRSDAGIYDVSTVPDGQRGEFGPIFRKIGVRFAAAEEDVRKADPESVTLTRARYRLLCELRSIVLLGNATSWGKIEARQR